MDSLGLDLGVLERVEIRQAFKSEPQKFTPWLAGNLHILAPQLGMEGMEAEGTEISVGPYRADIVASLPDGTKVIIENQLEAADLKHLGQGLAYLTGLSADVMVWIATKFDDAHLTAIRWLNEHTVAPYAFFAVTVGAVRIGDSKIAPVFEVRESPNTWVRQVQESGREIDEHGELRREFWAHYKDRVPAAGIPVGTYTNVHFQSNEELDAQVHVHLFKKRVSVYVRFGDYKEEHIERAEAKFRAGLGNGFNRQHGQRYFETIKWVDIQEQSNWDEIVNWLEQQRQIYLTILDAADDSLAGA